MHLKAFLVTARNQHSIAKSFTYLVHHFFARMLCLPACDC